MKGFKALTEKMTSNINDFQYKTGKTYVMEPEEIIPCEKGFHFCKTIADCYRFYAMDETTRIFAVTALGVVKSNDDIKYVTNVLRIDEEITDWRRKGNFDDTSAGYRNSGRHNAGHMNEGNFNTGSRNSGDFNTGSWNSGDFNTGESNLGIRNAGHCNKGHRNSGSNNSGNGNSGIGNHGDFNSGDCNFGSGNSGNWNTANNSSGCFCTEEPEMLLFDKPSGMTMTEFENKYTEERHILKTCPFGMTEVFDATLDHMVTVETSAKDRIEWWNELGKREKELIKSLPNFDMDKFRKCMGMDTF